MSNIEHDYILRSAESMKVFAGEHPTFVYGEWKAWRAACMAQGKAIPPAEWKAARESERTGAAPPFALWSEERWESTSPRDRGIETFFALNAVGAYTPKMQSPTMEDARLLLMTGKYDPGMPTVTPAPGL